MRESDENVRRCRFGLGVAWGFRVRVESCSAHFTVHGNILFRGCRGGGGGLNPEMGVDGERNKFQEFQFHFGVCCQIDVAASARLH